jgi:(2Fe-2S) ferredoxin
MANNNSCHEPNERCVLVCQHQTCLKNGSAKVLEAFGAVKIPGVQVEGSGCQGQCSSGPTVRILPEETWYWQVKPNDVPVIIEQDLRSGKPVEAKLNRRVHLSWEMFSP